MLFIKYLKDALQKKIRRLKENYIHICIYIYKKYINICKNTLKTEQTAISAFYTYL